jgi:hypothetical protein
MLAALNKSLCPNHEHGRSKQREGRRSSVRLVEHHGCIVASHWFVLLTAITPINKSHLPLPSSPYGDLIAIWSVSLKNQRAVYF